MTSSVVGADCISVGGPAADSRASLCIYAPDIDLEQVTALVGCAPSEAHRRGEVVGKRPPAPVGLWSLEAPTELSFEEKLKYLVEQTTSDRAAWTILGASHTVQIRCALFLHSWTEGFDLPAVLVAEIGLRGWAFTMAAYSADGDEIVAAFLAGQAPAGGASS